MRPKKPRTGLSLLAGAALLLAGATSVVAQEFQMTGVVSSATQGTPLQYAVVGIPELRFVVT